MTTETPQPRKPYHIVVGFDFSDLGARAVEEALDIARSRAPTELHLVTVARPNGTLVDLPHHDAPMTEVEGRGAVERTLSEIVKANQLRSGPVGLEKISVFMLA